MARFFSRTWLMLLLLVRLADAFVAHRGSLGYTSTQHAVCDEKRRLSTSVSPMLSRRVGLASKVSKEEEPLELPIGAGGVFSCLVVLYSEFSLKSTGCGLPAGPLGLVGLTEGLSYLAVIAIVAWSLFTKARMNETRHRFAFLNSVKHHNCLYWLAHL
jgi:hypothetical protein